MTNVSDLWGQFIQTSDLKTQEFGAGDSHLLFVGSEKSGKTTLQNLFFGRVEDRIQPTLALNYQSCTVRASGREIVLHFWELGGGLQLESILDTVITENTQKDFIIFVCIDLNSPSSLLEGVDWIERINSRFDKNRRAVYFIGTCYDIFEVKDPHDKEIIVQGLRAIAAQNNAGICFVSQKSEQLVNRFKNIIKFVGIARASVKEAKNVEPLLPLFVAPGSDNEASSMSNAVAEFMNKTNQEAAGERERSPKETANQAENPVYAEEDIDSLRAARRAELQEKLKTK